EFVGLQPRQRIDQFLNALAPAFAAPLPTGEAELRLLVEAEPDNRPARRELGRLLIAAGRLDAADGVLAAAAEDPVSDGLRARIELLRDGDGGLAVGADDSAAAPAVRALIEAIRGSREP